MPVGRIRWSAGCSWYSETPQSFRLCRIDSCAVPASGWPSLPMTRSSVVLPPHNALQCSRKASTPFLTTAVRLTQLGLNERRLSHPAGQKRTGRYPANGRHSSPPAPTPEPTSAFPLMPPENGLAAFHQFHPNADRPLSAPDHPQQRTLRATITRRSWAISSFYSKHHRTTWAR